MVLTPYFVSLHPGIALDENLSLFEDLSDARVRLLLGRAAGVLLPNYITPTRYGQVTGVARAWFPRLEARFQCRGKSAQIELFRQLRVRHPDSVLFSNPRRLVEHFAEHGSPWGYPLVMKGDLGGGGVHVFPIYTAAEVKPLAGRLPHDEPALLQRWVDHRGQDLRVVVYGDLAVSYFRVGDGRFYNNVCRGGYIDYELWPERQRQGIAAVKSLCRRVGIDIAGFDLMFPDEDEPVFVEINHHFGRKGLGGTPGHRRYFLQAVEQWRSRCLHLTTEGHPATGSVENL